jgi:hypothetical protein
MARTHYVGKAGHLAVMSELALRGYNVAMPEIDVGDDIFAVNDSNGSLYRVQVKTSQGTQRNKSVTAQFRIRLSQIRNNALTPDLSYVFVARRKVRWKFLVMERAVLLHLMNNDGVGTESGGYLQLTVTFKDDQTVTASGSDLSRYYKDWSRWPVLP